MTAGIQHCITPVTANPRQNTVMQSEIAVAIYRNAPVCSPSHESVVRSGLGQKLAFPLNWRWTRMTYSDWLNLIEVLGVLAFSMTGIFEARRLKMDIVGTYSVAMITAFGGGTVRDLCLQRYPLFWIRGWPYGVVVLVLSVVSVVILKQITDRAKKKLILVVTIFDALGLGLFSVLGAFTPCRSTRTCTSSL